MSLLFTTGGFFYGGFFSPESPFLGAVPDVLPSNKTPENSLPCTNLTLTPPAFHGGVLPHHPAGWPGCGVERWQNDVQ